MVLSDFKSMVDHDKIKAGVLEFLFSHSHLGADWGWICRFVEGEWPQRDVVKLHGIVTCVLSALLNEGRIVSIGSYYFSNVRLTTNQWLLMASEAKEEA